MVIEIIYLFVVTSEGFEGDGEDAGDGEVGEDGVVEEDNYPDLLFKINLVN